MLFARLNRSYLPLACLLSLLFIASNVLSRNFAHGQEVVTASHQSLASAVAAIVDPLTLTAGRRPSWQTSETANFRVRCVGAPAEAQAIARACESVRELLHATWLHGSELPVWSTKCDVVLHPTATQYHAYLGRGSEQSSGCSTIDIDGECVISRRIDICATSIARLAEVLPHEMTHVVLTDRFTSSPVPRWAAEGMSILAEPHEKQQLRSAVLESEHLAQSPVRVHGLLRSDDYPAVDFRGSFYAHSAILVRFLAERESPHYVVRFLEQADRDGYEVALRDVYQIEGVAHLDRIWRATPRRDHNAATTSPSLKLQPVALHLHKH